VREIEHLAPHLLALTPEAKDTAIGERIHDNEDSPALASLQMAIRTGSVAVRLRLEDVSMRGAIITEPDGARMKVTEESVEHSLQCAAEERKVSKKRKNRKLREKISNRKSEICEIPRGRRCGRIALNARWNNGFCMRLVSTDLAAERDLH
jgi:hypothetical protein